MSVLDMKPRTIENLSSLELRVLLIEDEGHGCPPFECCSLSDSLQAFTSVSGFDALGVMWNVVLLIVN